MPIIIVPKDIILQPSTSFFRQYQHIMQIVLQGYILFIFAIGSLYWRPRWLFSDDWPGFIRDGLNSPTSSVEYQEVFFARYALTPFIFFLITLWVVAGLPGLGPLIRSRLWFWLASFGLLVAWVVLSTGWAENTAVARSQAAQWMLTFGFVTVLLAVAPSSRSVSIALIAGMVFQAAVGIAQSYSQADIGINWIDDNMLGIGLGLFEFPLDPEESGVSVIQAEGIRYLRAYGVSSHPNLLATTLVLGILSGFWLWERVDRRLTSVIMSVGIWALFLTFSRASFGGLIIGMASLLLIWAFTNHFYWNGLAAMVGTFAVLASIFYVFYYPLVDVRLGFSEENPAVENVQTFQDDNEPIVLESRSTAEREILNEQAVEIIEDNPISGIGIGGFPWKSTELLRDRPELDMQGQNVHSVYLLALAELGAIGGALIVVCGVLALGQILVRRRYLTLATVSLLAALVGWLAIGTLEFFFWSLMPYQVLFWGTVAVVLKDSENEPDTIDDVADAATSGRQSSQSDRYGLLDDAARFAPDPGQAPVAKDDIRNATE